MGNCLSYIYNKNDSVKSAEKKYLKGNKVVDNMSKFETLIKSMNDIANTGTDNQKLIRSNTIIVTVKKNNNKLVRSKTV